MAKSRNIAAVQKQIDEAVKRAFKEYTSQAVLRIERKVKAHIRSVLLNDPTIESIKNGVLRGEFGLTAASGKGNAVVKAVIDSFQTKNVQVTFNRRFARLTMQIVSPNLDGVLDITEADQETPTSEVTSIPWLEWLIRRGRDKVVKGHGVLFGSSMGRSGLPFIMIGGEGNKSLSYQVPKEYSGTERTNFITKAIARARKDIEAILRSEREHLIKAIKK